jgi:hypothetical protein
MRKACSIMLITAAVLLSCDREAVDIEYPDYKQKMVIIGYISPDKMSNLIGVSSNLRIYGDE